MRIVVLSFPTGNAFLDLVAQTEDDWVSWRTSAALEEGERVLIEFRFPGLASPMLMSADVELGEVPGQFWLRFAPDERATLAYLIRVANGQVASVRSRRHRRYPLSLHVEWVVPGTGGQRRAGKTIDISAAGCFVATALTPPPVATLVEVDLTFPSGDVLHLNARVSRTRGRAMGMSLVFDPASPDAARLRADLRRCEERGELD